MHRAWKAFLFAAVATVAVGAIANQSDARPRHRRHVVRGSGGPTEAATIVAARPLPAPMVSPFAALTAGALASSYNNPLYGSGAYYAPSAGYALGNPGYGYFGY